jgi:hypothetical protein
MSLFYTMVSFNKKLFIELIQSDKMFLLKAENIYETFSPLHFLSMILGLNSFSINRDGNNGGKFEGKLTIWKIVILLVITLWGIFVGINYASGVKLWEISQENLTDLHHNCSLILTIVEIIISITIDWWTLFKKNTFINILNAINHFDKELDVLNCNVNYPKHKRNLILLMLLPCILNFSILISCLSSPHDVSNVHDVSIFTVIHDTLIVQSIGFIVIQFGYFVKCILLRIKILNNRLNSIYKEDILLLEKIQEIQHIVALNDKLVDIADEICIYYGLPVSIDVTKYHSKFSISHNLTKQIKQ